MTRAHAILDTALIMSFIALVFFAPLVRINRRFRRGSPRTPAAEASAADGTPSQAPSAAPSLTRFLAGN